MSRMILAHYCFYGHVAISLSLSESTNSDVNFSRVSNLDMSYEVRSRYSYDHSMAIVVRFPDCNPDQMFQNLVLLENVKCTAPPSLVRSLSGYVFKKGDHHASTEAMEE